MGGRQVASLSSTAQPPKQLLNFEFLPYLIFKFHIKNRKDDLQYHVSVRHMAKDSVSHNAESTYSFLSIFPLIG